MNGNRMGGLPSYGVVIGWAVISLVIGVVAGALQPWPGDVQLARAVAIGAWAIGMVVITLWKGRDQHGDS